MSELISQGGPIILLQGILAFLALVYVLERLLFFQGAKANTAHFLLGISNHIRQKAYAEAVHESKRAPGPYSRVASAITSRHYLNRSELAEVAKEAARMEIPRIERHLRPLLAIALLAPLLGMLGTVLGLLDVFSDLKDQGNTFSTLLFSKGIFEALITTAIGLAISSASYLFYLWMVGKAKRLLHRIELVGIEMTHMIADSKEQRQVLSFREGIEKS